MKLTGTFLDEISHDIPHQNWSAADWDQDFATMKTVGIDTVILIRCGHQRWLTYPSDVLLAKESAYRPPVDLVDLFLTLAEKYGLAFYFGTYDSGNYWHRGEFNRELDLNQAVVDEVWARYGHRPAFKGWYLTQEISRRTWPVVELFQKLGSHCKAVSGGLPVLISPWMDGVKAVSAFSAQTRKATGVTLAQHEQEWDEVLGGIRGAVDIVAFQDGHVEFGELPEYLAVNKKLADRHGLHCWTNTETFDRDMPIKFLPIKWEKLLLKLNAAAQVGVEKAITFEFSHFLSPHSAYPQAHQLYKRYCEHFKVPVR